MGRGLQSQKKMDMYGIPYCELENASKATALKDTTALTWKFLTRRSLCLTTPRPCRCRLSDSGNGRVSGIDMQMEGSAFKDGGF